MNETAKLIRFYKTGGSEVLRTDEVQLPHPKENEALVRVQAVALSRLDLLWREGAFFEEPAFPARIGYDAAGVVESVGPEVKKLKVGDRVSTFPGVHCWITRRTATESSILRPRLLHIPRA
jgi:NADPH:quinone reductase-like Zn-dependent oxidoreductase